MKLKRLRLQHFRNIEFTELNFNTSSCHFFHGKNGQGKTNLLESIHLFTALRSFRTHELKHLISFGHLEAQVLAEFEHDILGDVTAHIIIKPQGREVFINQTKIAKVSEVVGHFPTVMLCGQDLQLIRGAPGLRRHLLDLFICTLDTAYLQDIRRYHQGITERNRILKQGSQTPTAHALLDAFEKEIASSSIRLIQKRYHFISKLSATFQKIHTLFASSTIHTLLKYIPDVDPIHWESADTYCTFLKNQRERDFILKTSTRGPHRDDFDIQLGNTQAKHYASEGEQRGIVLALRLAQLELLQQHLNLHPILLADDVLGELDPLRRTAFWHALPSNIQIIASGTFLHLDEQTKPWQVFEVSQGCIFSKEKQPLDTSILKNPSLSN